MERVEKLKTLLKQTDGQHDAYLELLLELITEQSMLYIGRLGKACRSGNGGFEYGGGICAAKPAGGSRGGR